MSLRRLAGGSRILVSLEMHSMQLSHHFYPSFMGQTRRYMCRCANVVVLVQFLEAWLQMQSVPNTRKQLKRVLNTEHETLDLLMSF